MSDQQLEQHLHDYFGYNSFREGQKPIIEAVLNKEHVFAVLPTGTGKSICYQLPAMMLDGTVIVVSPLLSLMEDQVKQIKANGFKKVAALNSMLTYQEKESILKRISSYQLIYLSPEMLQINRIIRAIKKLNIHLFVIDEAHCISQWGHEFRPDYLRITDIHQALGSPPLLALTATATPDVQRDILTILQLKQVRTFIYPMDKANISLVVESVTQLHEKQERIRELVSTYRVPTLVYFSSREETAKVAAYLQSAVKDRNIAFYHGGLDNQDRLLIQQQFMNNQIDIVCCTNAFGMGINKKDIQLVIHYHIPSQIESFIQEIGRAGREGQEVVSLTLFHESDAFIPRRLIESELPTLSLIQQQLEIIYQTEPTVEEVRQSFLLSANGVESQWRFFQYQLERLGLLKHASWQINAISHQDVLDALESTMTARMAYKEQKLSEMLQWIYIDKCRRDTLFRHFQNHVQDPSFMCCSYCDFKWEHWQPEEMTREERVQEWQQLLSDLLYQGEKNEKQSSTTD
ncbi:RecQ family ATP-dependent DNA helicase [Gracilibacillus salinarum]|uniref:RecQ family ATP-dependent DNA helicase n=1 Tax=Gracilibacillus salinarum TaxID=2932255 RepID=A0ABY4GQD0_9BACI|nr:RecQ family ATP-dependent DNA helicase [Gracilibacillus salinarum]UOQ85907.1 RecQ family ATP-dependent DNA helicase [Gracilibacillus salinarum]